MDFLRSVEEDLRSLSDEARKKYPVVKEAAERGILKLRAMREQYAAAIKVESAPSTAMFRSEDILRPFLLACNHNDATVKMVTITLQGMQRLAQRDAINGADMPNIMRVLLIQVYHP
jgi:hypothetical protein